MLIVYINNSKHKKPVIATKEAISRRDVFVFGDCPLAKEGTMRRLRRHWGDRT